MKYQVWSTHAGPRPERDEKPTEPAVPAVDMLETTRTDRKAAEEDVGIFSSIFHRRAWINEVKS